MVDIRCYIRFKCTTQWLNNSIHRALLALLSVTICHHTMLLQCYWLYVTFPILNYDALMEASGPDTTTEWKYYNTSKTWQSIWHSSQNHWIPSLGCNSWSCFKMNLTEGEERNNKLLTQWVTYMEMINKSCFSIGIRMWRGLSYDLDFVGKKITKKERLEDLIFMRKYQVLDYARLFCVST